MYGTYSALERIFSWWMQGQDVFGVNSVETVEHTGLLASQDETIRDHSAQATQLRLTTRQKPRLMPKLNPIGNQVLDSKWRCDCWVSNFIENSCLAHCFSNPLVESRKIGQALSEDQAVLFAQNQKKHVKNSVMSAFQSIAVKFTPFPPLLRWFQPSNIVCSSISTPCKIPFQWSLEYLQSQDMIGHLGILVHDCGIDHTHSLHLHCQLLLEQRHAGEEVCLRTQYATCIVRPPRHTKLPVRSSPCTSDPSMSLRTNRSKAAGQRFWSKWKQST